METGIIPVLNCKNSTMEKFHYGKIPLCFKCEQYQIAKFILLKTAKNYTILYIC